MFCTSCKLFIRGKQILPGSTDPTWFYCPKGLGQSLWIASGRFCQPDYLRRGCSGRSGEERREHDEHSMNSVEHERIFFGVALTSDVFCLSLINSKVYKGKGEAGHDLPSCMRAMIRKTRAPSRTPGHAARRGHARHDVNSHVSGRYKTRL